MYIYKITNKINGKVYVGQTVHSVEYRWKQHCRKTNLCRLLKKAIEKYGKENFTIETLEVCSSIEELCKQETYWITFYNSFGKAGYNLTSGGENFIRSEETKNKMRKPKPEGFSEKLSLAKRGKKREAFSQEWIENMSNSRKGDKNPMFGKTGCGAKKIKCLNTEKVYNSIAAAARDLNLFSQSISDVINNNYSHTKGYKFILVEDDNNG